MRKCLTPGCRKKLNDCVPEKVRFCVNCQLKIRDITGTVKSKLSGRTLPDEALAFIANHTNGSTLTDLASIISKVKGKTLALYCRMGKISAHKIQTEHHGRGCYREIWWVPLDEAIALLDWAFNEIRFKNALAKIGANERTFGKDLKNGRLEVEIKIDRFGFKTIDRKALPQLKDDYHALREKLPLQKGFRLSLKKNQMSLTRAAIKMGVPYKTAEYWLLVRYLTGQKIHGKWLITFEDLSDFVKKTLDGAFPIIARNKSKLREASDSLTT